MTTPNDDERMERIRRAMREHHAGVQPDAGFAARVVARIDDEPVAVFGPIALKMMPAAALLVLALTGWIAITEPATNVAPNETTGDELIAWLVDDAGTP